jgi:hypothetical protein
MSLTLVGATLVVALLLFGTTISFWATTRVAPTIDNGFKPIVIVCHTPVHYRRCGYYIVGRENFSNIILRILKIIFLHLHRNSFLAKTMVNFASFFPFFGLFRFHFGMM